jgi:hypothetical protein
MLKLHCQFTSTGVDELRWMANVLCLAGIALSLIPIFVSWIAVDESPDGINHFSAVEVLSGEVHSSCNCLVVSSTLFVAGTFFLLVSPLGSVVQLSGVSVLLAGFPYSVTCGSYCIFSADASLGTAVSIVAGVLPLVGLAYPFGIGRGLKLARLTVRFLTFGKHQ